MHYRPLFKSLVAFMFIAPLISVSAEEFVWQTRKQVRSESTAPFTREVRTESWDASQTAFIVCDVWDKHHCLNAVRRLEEFGPRLNEVLKEARRRGAVVIHAPSDCMDAYQDHPARLRSISTPAAASLPAEIQHWCSRIPAEEQAAWPIDQSDGGEDDDPDEHQKWADELKALGRNPGMPWKSQSSMIEIDAERDFISDRGDEVWNILEHHGIQNVVLTGVHTNMCVLGRPFGLRQLVRNGRHVVLMRDMTDCMYNPQRWPWVDHFTGNDLVISHVERFVCPTVTSDQVLGGKPFRFHNDHRKLADVTELESVPLNSDRLTKAWAIVSLPGTWHNISDDQISETAGPVWYRCVLRLRSVDLQNQKAALLVHAPADCRIQVWLNGTSVKGIQPFCLACSEPEPTRFNLPLSAISVNDASLLVVRVQYTRPTKSLLAPPDLECGQKQQRLSGRWQARLGDDDSWTNMPLPAKFGTATDIVFEMK